MTQAIGRARRWGQEKLVHVYHFVTTKTIDVDIIEQRNQGKMLVSGALALGGRGRGSGGLGSVSENPRRKNSAFEFYC